MNQRLKRWDQQQISLHAPTWNCWWLMTSKLELRIGYLAAREWVSICGWIWAHTRVVNQEKGPTVLAQDLSSLSGPQLNKTHTCACGCSCGRKLEPNAFRHARTTKATPGHPVAPSFVFEIGGGGVKGGGGGVKPTILSSWEQIYMTVYLWSSGQNPPGNFLQLYLYYLIEQRGRGGAIRDGNMGKFDEVPLERLASFPSGRSANPLLPLSSDVGGSTSEISRLQFIGVDPIPGLIKTTSTLSSQESSFITIWFQPVSRSVLSKRGVYFDDIWIPQSSSCPKWRSCLQQAIVHLTWSQHLLRSLPSAKNITRLLMSVASDCLTHICHLAIREVIGFSYASVVSGGLLHVWRSKGCFTHSLSYWWPVVTLGATLEANEKGQIR